MEDILIRQEKESEYREVENLVRESFWNVYRPGALEHYILNQIRNDDAFVKDLDLVMELNGEIIGQVSFMKSNIVSDDGENIPVLTLGPISIANEYKGKGYGKKLLDYSLEKVEKLFYKAVCLEGDINFYGKCGFKYGSEYGIKYHDLSEGDDTSFFLINELVDGYLDGIKGIYSPPKGYFIDEDLAKDFDKNFPYKEKLKLPGQIF